MTSYYYARSRKVEVEIVPGVRAVPPRPWIRSALFGALGSMSGAIDAVKALSDAKPLLDDGWRFLDESKFSLSLDRLRRYAVVRHTDGKTAVLTGRLCVRARGTTALRRLLAKHGLSLVHVYRFAPNLYQVAVPVAADPLRVAIALGDDGADWAEPELLEPLKPCQTLPPDPRLADQNQWAAVDAHAAWNDGAFGSGVRIGIVDKGCLLHHLDLGRPFGPLGFFKDGADAKKNFVTSKFGIGFPDGSHGTFCAGMALARANNREGGRGMAPGAILTVVGLGRSNFSQDMMARALSFAARPSSEIRKPRMQGVDIISCSVDVTLPVRGVLHAALDAMARARSQRGVPVFWAVRNEDIPIAADGVWSHPNVIPVGSSVGRERRDTCAFGDALEFLAPGRDVFSTSSSGGYGTSSGTSFATPVAAGIAALVLGINPELTATEVRALLRACCTPSGGNGRTPREGHGILNAAAAVRLARESLR